MATVGRDIQSVELSAQELWHDGPPYELFSEMRRKCPIHWTESLEEFPEEAGFWSVTTADDVYAVTRDFRTYSSELGGVLVALGESRSSCRERCSSGWTLPSTTA